MTDTDSKVLVPDSQPVEFEIITSAQCVSSDQETEEISCESRKRASVVEYPEVKPAWTDDESDEESQKLIAAKIPKVLDVLKATEALDSDDECITVSRQPILKSKPVDHLPLDSSLDVRKCGLANEDSRATSSITSAEFNERYEMLLTASTDTSLALFDVNNDRCDLLRRRVFEQFPISCAKFTAAGSKVVMSSVKSPHFRIYDLESSCETRSSPMQGRQKPEFQSFALSPDDSLGAFASKNELHIVDMNALERISVLHVSSPIVQIYFTRDGQSILCMNAEGSVLIYDSRNSANVHFARKIRDKGNYSQGVGMDCSNDGRWLACGSKSGHVNLYSMRDVLKSDQPEPTKVLDHLTSSADLLKFHPKSELLCFASSQTEASLKFYHLNGLQVMENISTAMGRLKGLSAVGFSPNGRYMCVGQQNGLANLYKLQHYSSY